MNIKKILSSNADGATLDAKTLKPVNIKTGYAVSITDNAVNNITQKEEAQLIKLIEDINSIAKKINLKSNAYYIGYWLDKKTGIGYLDITLHIEDLKTAKTLAKIHDQKAIFSFRTFQEIRT